MKGSHQALTFSPQEAELIATAQTDSPAGRAAQERLLDTHVPLIFSILGRFHVPPRYIDPDRFDDSFQSAREAFLRAIRLYDSTRRVALWTFARPFVLGAVRVAVMFEWKPSTLISLEAAAEEEDRASEDALAAAHYSDRRDAVRAYVEGLPPLQRDVVIRIFWLGETQATIRRMRGRSAMSVSKQLKAALKRGREELAMWNPHLEAAA